MKTSTPVRASLAAVAIFLAACSGKEGPTGPAGAQGAQGPQGAQGVQGNANVIIYTYGSKTFTGTADYALSNISQGTIDSSLVLAYYNPSIETATSWYPVPGLGPGALWDTRYLIYQTSTNPSNYVLSVRLVNPSTNSPYASSATFTKFRIIIARASSIVPQSQSLPLDLNNYELVKARLGLPD